MIRKANEINVELGTELKLNIHIEPIGGMTLKDYDYTTEVYCSQRRKITIPKADAIYIDDENFVVCVDSSILGIGTIVCKVIAHIPDADFQDGIRTEVVAINTGINIVKN